MKRSNFFKLIIFLLVIGTSFNSIAQEWRYINTYNGIDVYWRYTKDPYATKYMCELKLENTNSYRVNVSFKPRFICADGNEKIDSKTIISIAANSSKGGQYAGLWWYPCRDGIVPSKGGYIEMYVSRED